MKDQRRSEGSPADRRALAIRYPWISGVITFAIISLVGASIKTWLDTKSTMATAKWHTEWIQKNNDSVGSIPHLVRQIDDQTREQRKFNERTEAKLDYLVRSTGGRNNYDDRRSQ